MGGKKKKPFGSSKRLKPKAQFTWGEQFPLPEAAGISLRWDSCPAHLCGSHLTLYSYSEEGEPPLFHT